MFAQRNPKPFATLQRFARRATEAAQEQCELCAEPIAREHRHLLDVEARQIICACRACSILFDREAASNGKYRLVPDRRLSLYDFELTETQWDRLRIPVGMAFFFYNTPAERVAAFYPSPMGQTESLLSRDAWEDLVTRNPVLREMQPDVEALLVNRARGARQHFLVPIDDCYSLVGLIRIHWRGLSGGQEVWKEIRQFFETLERRSKPRGRHGEPRTAAPRAMAPMPEER